MEIEITRMIYEHQYINIDNDNLSQEEFINEVNSKINTNAWAICSNTYTFESDNRIEYIDAEDLL